MENGILQKWPRFPTGDKLEFRRKLLVFSFFLLFSVIIWLLNALGKNYTDFIDYPVTFSNLPQNKILIGELTENLDLRVNARGYALLRYKLIGRPEPIQFNLSSFAMSREGNDSSRLFILTRYVKDQVSRQLPSELQLIEIKPDSLQFHFATLKDKRVPVKSNLRFEIDKQFTIREKIFLTPDSVDVKGPDFMLDTMKAIYTVNNDLGLISKTYSGEIGLKPDKNIECSVNKVNCLIELERFTEVEFYVPITVLNMPDTVTLQTFPSRIKVTCNVGLSQYERIDENLFRATIDYANITEGGNRLQVNLSNVPVYVRSFDYSPRTVEFLISGKK